MLTCGDKLSLIPPVLAQPFQSGNSEGEEPKPLQSCKKSQSKQAAAGNKPQCQATLLLGIKITHFPSGSRWEAEELKTPHCRRGNVTLAVLRNRKEGEFCHGDKL